MTRRRVSLRWPAALGVGAALLVGLTSAGMFAGVTVCIAWAAAVAVLVLWGNE